MDTLIALSPRKEKEHHTFPVFQNDRVVSFLDILEKGWLKTSIRTFEVLTFACGENRSEVFTLYMNRFDSLSENLVSLKFLIHQNY